MITRLWLILALGAAAGAGYFFAGSPVAAPSAQPSVAARTYQCPMHPWIKLDRLGKCTICGMDLVTTNQPGGNDSTAADPDLVTLTPTSAAITGVQTAIVKRGLLIRTTRVAGVIADDETRHRILAARVPGRVEKLFVNYVGAEVTAGAPLVTIYSPELLTAQRVYLERLKAGTSAYTQSERSAARERLLELGLTNEEITILEHTQEPTAILTVRAPMTGTVVTRSAYEGQYVQTNDPLFEIGDFATMWFVFDAHESDLPWLRLGQQVEVTTPSRPGQILTAPIAFINPNLNAATRTVSVRVVLTNTDRTLLHEQTALGRVRIEQPDTLIVERRAVLQHSGAPIVYLEQANHGYVARTIQLGRIGDEFAEVLAGLAEGDRVVTAAALILDSQAQLAHAATGGPTKQVIAPRPSVRDATPAKALTASSTHLITLALVSADGAAALAADNFDAYQKILPTMRRALIDFLANSSEGKRGPLADLTLPDQSDLRMARRDFEPYSTALADLVRSQHLLTHEKIWIFECPMSPVLGTGRWLQRTPELKNPFFGSAMLSCGEEVK